MTANASALASITYEAESSWGEDVTTFTTHRLQTATPVDVSGIVQDKIPSDVVVQYRNDGTQWILSTMGGTFKTKHWLTGHGSTMVGSPTVSARETLLGLVIGNAPALSAAASTTLTGGTAAVPTTTASGTFSAGGLCRVGALGDGDGDGQFFSIDTHITTNLTLHGALNGAPVNGAVLYPVSQLFPPESPTSSAVSSARFLLQTANLQYECHGCFAESVTFSGLNAGETPSMEVTWRISWYRYSTATFPNTTSTDTFLPAPIAAGSWNVQVVGTTTRDATSLQAYRSLTLTHTLGVVPLEGPGGVHRFQKIVGARRVPDKIQISYVVDAPAAGTSPTVPAMGTGTSFFYGVFTGSTNDGSAFGFKCPKMCVVGVPTQMNDGGLNRLRVTLDCHSGTTTTSNLTLAAIVYGMA